MLKMRMEGKSECVIPSHFSVVEIHLGNGLLKVIKEPEEGSWTVETYEDFILRRDSTFYTVTKEKPIASLSLDGVEIEIEYQSSSVGT